MTKALFLTLAATLTLSAESVESIIEKMENNTRGVENAYQKVTMQIKTKRGLRTMKMESWSKGTERSFIKVNYPKKDKGITFLKINKEMWQYIPKIEKTIKIPASMMMQSWMGSDFSNDDMVKESSMTDDYTSELLSEDSEKYTIKLTPKEDAAVVWGKVVVNVQKKSYAPLNIEYYDEDDMLERTMYFKDNKMIDGIYFAHTIVMQPASEDKKENTTTVKFSNVDFNPKLNDAMFTKRALQRYSR